MAWMEQHNKGQLVLEMQSKNYPAICLAIKLGFEFCGYNDRYYQNQDIVLFFAKEKIKKIMALFESILRSLNQVFEAGVAITALSLFVRSLSFNLRDRVSRIFRYRTGMCHVHFFR